MTPKQEQKAARMLWGYFFGRFRPSDVMEPPETHDYISIADILRECERYDEYDLNCILTDKTPPSWWAETTQTVPEIVWESCLE